MGEPPKRSTVTFEQLTYSNMLTLNAPIELLNEKGVLSKHEILGRVRKLCETQVTERVIARLRSELGWRAGD